MAEMTLRIWRLAVTHMVAVMLACAVTPSLAAVRVVNLAPGLLEAAEAAPAMREAVLARNLGPVADLYRELLGMSDLNTASRQYAASLEAQRPGLKKLADAGPVEAELAAYVASFRERFPAFDAAGLSIYLLPSFGQFQAQARTLHGHPALLLDTAFFATLGSLPRPFVQHELFHLYHYQLRPDASEGSEVFFRTGRPPPLGTLLWFEGLAVHVARELNPGAPNSELFPAADIVPATQAQYPRLLHQAAEHAGEADVAAICQFFYFPCPGGQSPIPLNSGYVLGEGLADQMLKSRSLEAVMRLQDREIVAAIQQAAGLAQTGAQPIAP